MNKTVIYIVAFFACLAVAFLSGWSVRNISAKLEASKVAEETANWIAGAEAKGRAEEQAAVQRQAKIEQEYENAKKDAETVPAAVVADLRAGNVKLRREWQGCEASRVSDTAAATAERDALTASRNDLAGAVVRAGRDADNQLAACQAVIMADREIGK